MVANKTELLCLLTPAPCCACCAVCRQPNVVSNKTELFVRNVRLLGFGEPVEREEQAPGRFLGVCVGAVAGMWRLRCR